MRRGRILILVLLIVIIGLVVAAVALRQFLTQFNQPPEPADVDVYIVGQSIAPGAAITEEVLSTISLPQDRVAAFMFTTDELAVLTTNKVAKYPLDPGLILTESMIIDKNAPVPLGGPQWAAVIPTGMVAKSVPASRLSLNGYAINDGAHVNINACFLFVDVDPTFQTILPNLTAVLTGTGFPPDALPTLSLGVGAGGGPQGRLELEPSVQQPYYLIPSEAQRPRPVCQMLLQDVVVMKLGNFPLTTTTAAAQPPAEQAAPVIPDLVTLIVSPQDSIMLDYLVYTNAILTMALRNPSDQGRQSTEASTLQFVLSQYNIPVPAKLPYASQPPITALGVPSLPNDTVTVSP